MKLGRSEKDSPKKEKIYSGSINDIKTYDVFGEDCSLVVYCAYSGRVREIIEAQLEVVEEIDHVNM